MFSHCETCDSDVAILEFEDVFHVRPPTFRDVRSLPVSDQAVQRLSRRSQHSPGPWELQPDDVRGESVSYDIRLVSAGTHFRNHVATFVPAGDAEHDRTTMAANIALTIAAPEMLRELENILFRLDLEPADSDAPCSALREGIRKTITKAKTITPKILAECSRLANDIESSDDASCDFD